MKHLLIALFTGFIGVSLVADDAEAARRLGGGGNSGMQRSVPMKRDAQPTPNAAPQRQAPPAQQPSGASRWLGPIAGLAAGIGLAALFSYLGLGEELATFLMLALIAVAVFFVIRMLLQRLRPQPQRAQYAGGPNLDGAHYQPPTAPGGAASRGVTGTSRLDLPEDFDADSFMRHAKLNFVRLQAANDARDVEDIRQFTTPEMFAEIKVQMQERAGARQTTDVVTLNAELVDFATEFRRQIASVRFYGTIRESAERAPEPFDEIWHVRKKAGDRRAPWLIAGIQQRDAA